MSDGREERQQKELERQREAQRDRSDWVDRDFHDQWKPERQES
jgi:hypothetical protein